MARALAFHLEQEFFALNAKDMLATFVGEGRKKGFTRFS